MIRVGPAGWSYKDWEGLVYPRPRPRGFDPLAFLAGLFDALELNTTFYHPARPHSAEAWLERTAHNPRFRFTAKLWRRFTHERTEAWTASEVALARAALDVLAGGGRLGAVLVQFPWSFRRTEPNEAWLHEVLSAFSSLPLVVEVRHDSWNVPAVYTALTERGVGFVNIDQPLFRHSLPPTTRATSAVGYVRVHGRNWRDWFRKGAEAWERYDYLYSAEELAPWAERAQALAAAPRVEDVYVVTNNHMRGKGVANALMLQAQLTGRPQPAPASLLAAYPEHLAGLTLPLASWEAVPTP